MDRYQILPLLGLVDGEGLPVLTGLVYDCLAEVAEVAAEAAHPALEAMAALLALTEAVASDKATA